MTDNLSAARLARVAVRLLEDVPQLMVRDAAAAVGLAEWTVYKYWKLAHPGTAPRGRRFTTKQHEVAIEPFAAFCDDMIAALVDGMTAGEWLSAVRRRCLTIAPRRDTPAAEERRFYRGMDRLLTTRRAARDGKKLKDATYRRTEP